MARTVPPPPPIYIPQRHVAVPLDRADDASSECEDQSTSNTSTVSDSLQDVYFAKEKGIEKEVDNATILPEKRPAPKRLFSYVALSPHRRIMFSVILVNTALLILAAIQKRWNNLPALSGYIAINISISIFIRQQGVINVLFKLATVTKTTFPLPVRWALAKVYHLGGLHSGCGIAAAAWQLVFAVCTTRLWILGVHHSNVTAHPSLALLIISHFANMLLVTIVILALPKFRMRFHNTFEMSHRFLGWTSIAVMYAQVVILIRDHKPADVSLAMAFFSSPFSYLLMMSTLCVISPWITLRRVEVSVTKPSDHAIVVQFPDRLKAFPGSSSAISLAPLREWHSFANIPKPGEGGFRLIISRAGDWTSSVIDSPPTHFWLRGIPTAGAANVESLFRKVLFVATGSGIGPVLPHLLARNKSTALFWSARSPNESYGISFVQEVLQACPDSEIHDTKAQGKPDMLSCTFRRLRECEAEAVICISNQKLTRKIVYGLEARGIPAFGAIWDS